MMPHRIIVFLSQKENFMVLKNAQRAFVKQIRKCLEHFSNPCNLPKIGLRVFLSIFLLPELISYHKKWLYVSKIIKNLPKYSY